MEDKIFELIEKMYNEMQNGFREVCKDIIRLDRKVDDKVDDVRQDIVRLENKMDENHKALYDGYKQNSEAVTEIREDIKDLKFRVENQEIALKVIRGGK